MNLPELKAIHSRLKRVAAGERLESVYPSDCKPGILYDEDRLESSDARYTTTPIDVEWLRELGFTSDGPQYSSMSLGPVSWHHRFQRLVLFGNPIPQVTQRGQLLQLLMGLGVFDE